MEMGVEGGEMEAGRWCLRLGDRPWRVMEAE